MDIQCHYNVLIYIHVYRKFMIRLQLSKNNFSICTSINSTISYLLYFHGGKRNTKSVNRTVVSYFPYETCAMPNQEKKFIPLSIEITSTLSRNFHTSSLFFAYKCSKNLFLIDHLFMTPLNFPLLIQLTNLCRCLPLPTISRNY